MNTIRINTDGREAFGVHFFDEFRRQLKYAARLLRKSPAFTATALLTLAVCFGANLTIFAVIDSVLLRPLPFPNPDRLMMVFNTYPKAGVERDGSSLANYYERRGRIPAFSSLSIYRYATEVVGEPGSTDREPTMRVSPEFFSTLGLGPAIGRTFTDEETTSDTDHVAILSNAYWRQRFNADPNVLGKQLRVNSVSRTVIGVLAPSFHFLSSDARVFLPLASSPEDRAPSRRHSGGNVIQMIARLRPEATLAQAQSELDAQNAALEVDDPQATMIADAGFRSLVVPLRADHVAAVRPMLLLLEAGALVLLLIGGVNLVNLLLIRASARGKELAVRQALGAGWKYLVSEVVVETTLLTFAGGMLGLAVGAGGIQLLRALGADRLPLGNRIVFDAPISTGRSGRSRYHGHRGCCARRVVQSSAAAGKCAAIGEPWRHNGARRANSAPQFCRRSDCPGVCFAGRSGSARPQSGASDGRFSGLSIGPRSDRANLANVGRLLGRSSPAIF
jgi:predicted permease